MPFSDNKSSPKKTSSHPKTPKDKGNEVVAASGKEELGAELYASSNRPEPETIRLPQATTTLSRETKLDQVSIYFCLHPVDQLRLFEALLGQD